MPARKDPKPRRSLAEPEGERFATRKAAKKPKTGKPPFPPFLPDDPVEAERLIRAEIKRRLADIDSGKDKPLPIEEAFAEIRARIRKRRGK